MPADSTTSEKSIAVAPPTAFRSELVYTVRRKGKCRNGQVTARQITFPELKRRCTMSTTCWIAVGVVGTLTLLCIIGRCCCCKKDKGCRNERAVAHTQPADWVHTPIGWPFLIPASPWGQTPPVSILAKEVRPPVPKHFQHLP